MGASVLRKKIQDAGFPDVTVVNKAISNLDDTYDLVVTHQDLTDRAAAQTPSAVHVSVDNFMASPRYDEIVELVARANGDGVGADGRGRGESRRVGAVLPPSSIVLGGRRRAATTPSPRRAQLLVAAGAVDAAYVDAMHEREARCRRTWATAWRSRTAPTRPRPRSGGTALSLRPLRRGDRLERQAGGVRGRHRRRR